VDLSSSAQPQAGDLGGSGAPLLDSSLLFCCDTLKTIHGLGDRKGQVPLSIEYSSGNLALQDYLYTPSTHTSLESPRNGGINGYYTFEHGLLQGEQFIITSKWGYQHRKGSFITLDTHIFDEYWSEVRTSCCKRSRDTSSDSDAESESDATENSDSDSD
jgi:hypothetical protein